MILGPNRIGLAAAAGLHVAVLGALLAYAPSRSALLSVTPIMVDWIAAPKPEPVVEPPKPRPLHPPVPRPVEKPPVQAAPAESPSPIVAPAPPPPPPEPVAAVRAPPVAITPPVFDAAYLQNPAPAYPTLSRRLKEQGKVILRVRVNPAGAADEVQVRTSSGFARLDESARDTVAHWRFAPARRGAEAVPEWVLIPVSFKLEG
jgi:protein TonB